MITSSRPNAQRAGRVRAARLTDLAALGELSRQSHLARDGDARMQTLGLPVGTGQVGVFTLFRLPLGALLPGDLLFVYEERGHVRGLARVEHEGMRDEWTIVELDAIDEGLSGDVRYRLIQRLLRDASKRGGLRFHVACADDGDNVELFMQAEFMRYGEEILLYRAPDNPPIRTMTPDQAQRAGIRSAVPLDALALDRLYRVSTPAPVARLEDYHQYDWERQGNHWRVPRSALTPILRFADVDGFVQETPGGKSDGELLAFCQIGVSKAEQPHYIRVISRPDHDPSDLISFGLSVIAERTRSIPAVVSAVRTYEAPLDRRFEEQGFADTANVSLLMKEVAERVRKPALVPAVLR